MPTEFGDSIIVSGDVTYSGDLQPGLARAQIVQDNLANYAIPFTEMRVHDAPQTVLPGTAAGDDLAIVGTSYGTDTLAIQTSDSKAASVTQYALFTWPLPVEFTAAQSVRVKVKAGMVTTVSDGTAVVDVEAYLSNDEGAVSGSDLVSTAAASVNSLTAAENSFVLDGSGLVPGSVLNIRVRASVVDSATATAVILRVGRVTCQADVKG